MALLFLLALPLGATEGKSGDFDPSSIVLGHIKDSYDWHVTDIGDKAVVIHLPIIVKSSTGWHVFSSSQFGEEADAKGYRHGPYGLAIASAGDHAGKIVELQSDGSEAVPLDISITKTVAVLFIDAILLLVCILIPARWARRHKASDAAPGGFVGFMEMLITYVEDNIVKPGVGEGYEKYSPYLLTCLAISWAWCLSLRVGAMSQATSPSRSSSLCARSSSHSSAARSIIGRISSGLMCRRGLRLRFL